VTSRAVRLRIAVTAGILAIVFAVLTGRAVQLTVIDGGDLRQLALRQHTSREKVPPRRGAIVDRSGEPLALTRESVAVYVRPRKLEAGPETLAMVARLLDVPAHVVAARAGADSPFVWLDRQVPLDRWAAVADLAIPGIDGEATRQRVYPYGFLASQVVGFVGIDGQGLEGIERSFDVDLRGEVDALDVEHDARGRRLVVDGLERPLPRVGAQVELTIDASLQRAAETELQEAVKQFGADAGTAVVMDPHTGEILAMANVPRFDPNSFARATAEQWRNRAVTDSYEPGSTFKAVVAAAALDAGVVRPEDTIWCENGAYPIGGRVIHDHHPEGRIPFSEVIARSSNIGAAKVAQLLGRERFGAAIQHFGFGAPTGIDLPGEVAGLVRPTHLWGAIHLATTAFGQGIAVTPLQLLRAYAALANGGFLMRPYVVRRVVDENGNEKYTGQPQVVARVVSAKTAAVVTSLLQGVIDHGTGQAAKIQGISLAGKTGTAQKVESGRYSPTARIGSFVAYGPAEDPRLVAIVVIDTPRRAKYGGVVAAPAVRKILQFGLDQRGVRPWSPPVPVTEEEPDLEPEPVILQTAAASAPEETFGATLTHGQVPRLLGLSMRDALVEAHRAGFAVRLSGSGYVVDQQPPPGAEPPAGEILLALGPEAH
jgi:cell division protein FtsI (penicillin-binding protein 3)